MIKPRTGKEINCLYCGEKVYVPKYRIRTFKYCSRSCAALAARTEHTTECIICKKSFTHISSRANKAKYCSSKCYHKGQVGKGQTEYTCLHCGKSFFDSLSTNRKYCSQKCVNKSHLSIWKPSFTTIRKAMNARKQITKCEICGYKEHIQILGVHHKDENRKNNELSNLIVVCPICHSLFHSKHVVH